MRFRTELVPIVAVVGAAVPMAGCGQKAQGDGADAGAKLPVIIKNRDDIPVQLGGAAVPYRPPPASSGSAASGAAGPPGAAAPSPAPAAAAQAAPAVEPAIAITHNHPPGQACSPLERAEVEKALADLRKQP